MVIPLLVASLPCHYMVDALSHSLFCGGFSLSLSHFMALPSVLFCGGSIFFFAGVPLSSLRLWLSFPLSIFAVVAFPPLFAVVLTFLSLFCSCVVCLFL